MQRDTDEMNLTAYALGELEGAEREAIEARLSGSADDRRFVAEVRAAAGVISQELAREQPSGLDAIHYAAIELRLRDTQTPRPTVRREGMGGRWGLALSLAASIAIVGGAVAIIWLALPSHHDAAVNLPATQPDEHPILIPLVGTNPAAHSSQPGLAFAPDGKTPFVSVADHPVSSFSMDPDTTVYEDVRQSLFAGRMPTRESVKVEGLINAFTYDDPTPSAGAVFGARIEVGQCPWQPEHQLARIAIRARSGEGVAAEGVRTEVAFVPKAVKSYRLIGYEGGPSSQPRSAGQSVPAGRAVTALYEIIPNPQVAAERADYLTLRLWYRGNAGTPEQLVQFDRQERAASPATESADFHFTAAVAEFGMALRDASHDAKARIAEAIVLAQSGLGTDSSGQRRAFIDLARQAEKLMG